MARSIVLGLLLLVGVRCAMAGAWGVSSFKNDDALDWVADLRHAVESQLLDSTLQRIDAKAKYVEAPDCAVALAAAEVIAAALGHPAKTVPSEVTEWIRQVRPRINEVLLAKARSAVTVCRDGKNSELRELWKDSRTEKDWLNDTSELLQRLK